MHFVPQLSDFVPPKNGFIVSAHSLPNITLLTLKDIGRRLLLQLQCSYQGQQGDVRQAVRGNSKTRF